MKGIIILGALLLNISLVLAGSECWRLSYDRGVGTVPSSCPDGWDKDGLYCSKPCDSGYKDVAGVCIEKCKDGYTDLGTITFFVNIFLNVLFLKIKFLLKSVFVTSHTWACLNNP